MHRLANSPSIINHQQQVGHGHVYQGRFKSFPISTDGYFHQAVRYVERNALRAKLVKRAEEWRWSSLWRRESGTLEQPAVAFTLAAGGPFALAGNRQPAG